MDDPRNDWSTCARCGGPASVESGAVRAEKVVPLVGGSPIVRLGQFATYDAGCWSEVEDERARHPHVPYWQQINTD